MRLPVISPSRSNGFLLSGCVIAIIVVLAFQLSSLYDTPVADSNRWGGDETWLMREFGNQVTHGAMQYPESFGAAPRTDGVLAGSMWIEALVYGASGKLLFPAYDLVSIGRTVTYVLSLILIGSVWWILRRLGIDPVLAAVLILGMIACPGFMFASHSGRRDILTGLALIWYLFLLVRSQSSLPSFWLGACAVLILIFSRHLLTLTCLASLCFLISGVRRHRVKVFHYLLGALCSGLILVVAYYCGSGELSLFGRGGAMGSYGFVLQQIPLMRPFSRNVQVSNLLERLHLLWTDSPTVLIMIAVAILAASVTIIFRRHTHPVTSSFTPDHKWLLYTALATLSWLLLQGGRPYYLYHIVPVVVIALGAVISSNQRYMRGWTLILLAGILVLLPKAFFSDSFGKRVRADQTEAIPRLLGLTPESRDTRILCDVASLNVALRDTSREILTLDMFQPPSEVTALIRKLHANRITHVLLRSATGSTEFEPGRMRLPKVLDSLGSRVSQTTGYFYDDAWDYGSMSDPSRHFSDTLILYRVP